MDEQHFFIAFILLIKNENSQTKFALGKTGGFFL